MEGVKDERMKALWRPFCAGEVRRDKPWGHHHQCCCQRCSCFLSCRASALSPASPSPRARQARARAEEAKILLSARTARGAGDGPRSADRSMGPGFHYVNWLLGQQRGRAGGGAGGGGGGEEVKEEEEQSFMIDSSSSPIRALDWHHAILSVGTHDNSPH